MRKTRAILTAVLLASAVLTCTAPAAIAGTFPVEACTSNVNYENHSLVFSTNNPTYIESHTSCGEPPVAGNPPKLVNLSLGETLGAGGVPVGAKGAWTFTAPAGTTITDVHGIDQLTKVGGNEGWNVYLTSEDTEGHTQLAQTCATSYLENECGIGGIFDVPGLKAKTVTLGVECDAEEYEPGHHYTTCARGNEYGHAVRAEFDEVTFTLNDPTPPTNVTGTNIPTSPQHGTITINGSAEDTIAGLTSLSVIDKNNKIISGLITIPGSCDYSQTKPCPPSATNIPLPVNTEELPDGTNEIQVLATNSAGDQETSPPYIITVENHSTSGGGGDSGGGTSGSNDGTSGMTGGSGTNDQNSGTATNHEEPPVSKSGGSSPVLPSLPLKLTKIRVKNHELLLYGDSSVLGNAVVWIKLSVHRHDHYWIVQKKVRLTRQHFRYSLRIPTDWKNAHATLEILYKGNAAYRLTRFHRSILI